ncbi:2Fe-2S iron-sulfur cluster-binding protein [Rhizobium rhizogenes]|uniref:2Fe-2S iron-sulfur cluster-binding protein n=1 Tax=Rhizobium rhizogenes TaxID=359 RepID=UPI000DDC5994|nr:pyridoxamine 5'-phosphate oxidase family protein [Rhizobium rhizogenes]NTG11797.1 2Fe-2S iron-sulfur cluster binding domain-containing protein [Rhizobium rhizogenes]NTH23308.1 2Fe-2S iron-sulfur cluster binding domain-containing protein [Rhizobium rhizogenes]NTH34169.1 2Fe-2S iron-sulfur cluster binding domain-containing protein [Rhizobium rhizogenes]NTI06409.1 2Fe-2S iron-sulfur cluster binding domain-containing protein [Rhizobium rhizogenes]NTI13220.1 2Fe-2S iron-sulfur cluster binding do
MSMKLTKLPTWHEGETFIQEKLGVKERMAAVGQRVVRDFMPDQHRDFYTQLPFVVLGSVDQAGDAWTTFIEGQPGFMSSPSPVVLDIAATRDSSDPASEGLSDGMPIGLLGIEMHTRRRNRMNGFVSTIDGGFRIDVDQSFGNCPRYIQLRDFAFERQPGQSFNGEVEHLPVLDDQARAIILEADAFFVASYVDREDRRQVDVSHRGGNAGFVRIGDDGVLTIPDFDGNLFFATLGNILLNGKAGLLFVDFATGDMLQMTGKAELIFDSPEIAAFQGAERFWTFKPTRIVRRRNALALRWAFQKDGWSPSSLMTGNWQQAADRLRATEIAGAWRPMIVAAIVDESATIKSFHLQPGDGVGLLPHVAGQHLPIRIKLPGEEKSIISTYTLSVAPSDGIYRISVKRDGRVSQFLHNAVAVGDVIEARAPAGRFTIDARSSRPAVLLAAGVGITPMLAMLRHVVYEGLRKQRARPVTLFYAARCKADRPFDKEIADLIGATKGVVRLVRVLSDTTDAEEGRDFDAAGRIDMALLTRFLPFNDYDFYLCGPAQFTQGLYDGLRAFNIADDRIKAEAFGPSSLIRTGNSKAAVVPAGAQPSAKPVPVVFTQSLKEARWTPGSGTLLELAEARGLEPEFSCREGNCGTCRTKLVKGAVAYFKEPTAKIDVDEVLLCCAVPADQEGGLQLAV